MDYYNDIEGSRLEGIEIGISKRRAEEINKGKLENIRNLKRLRVDVDIIVKATKLNKEEILKL